MVVTNSKCLDVGNGWSDSPGRMASDPSENLLGLTRNRRATCLGLGALLYLEGGRIRCNLDIDRASRRAICLTWMKVNATTRANRDKIQIMRGSRLGEK